MTQKFVAVPPIGTRGIDSRAQGLAEDRTGSAGLAAELRNREKVMGWPGTPSRA